MEILFNYLELVIMQNECGEVYVVSLFDTTGKVEKVNDIFGITNDEIISNIKNVMWNNLYSNDDIEEYIEAYKRSYLYKYTKIYGEN